MKQPGNHQLDRPGYLHRFMLAGMGFALLTLLAVARRLEPDPQGYGTHRQLGLPPCSFLTLFSIRCPSCGMTTSWARVVRGQWVRAASANTGGMLLAVLAIGFSPWALGCAATGRWWGTKPRGAVLAVVMGTVVAVTLTDWLWRLAS